MTSLELAEFRRRLNAKPPTGVRGEGTPWRQWFDFDTCECGHLKNDHWHPSPPSTAPVSECWADAGSCACSTFRPVYIGERSARTGPDVVTADEKARQAADVAPGRANGAETAQTRSQSVGGADKALAAVVGLDAKGGSGD